MNGVWGVGAGGSWGGALGSGFSGSMGGVWSDGIGGGFGGVGGGFSRRMWLEVGVVVLVEALAGVKLHTEQTELAIICGSDERVAVLVTTNVGELVQVLPGEVRSSYRFISAKGAAVSGVVAKLYPSLHGDPDSIPGRVDPGFSHVGMAPDDAAGRRVFSGISRFPTPFHSAHAAYLSHPHRLSRPRCLETPKSLHSLSLSFPRHAQDMREPFYYPTVVIPGTISGFSNNVLASFKGEATVAFASHQEEPGSIPGVLAPSDVAGLRVFSGISRFMPPLRSGAALHSPLFTLVVKTIGYRKYKNISKHLCTTNPIHDMFASRIGRKAAQCWDTEIGRRRRTSSLMSSKKRRQISKLYGFISEASDRNSGYAAGGNVGTMGGGAPVSARLEQVYGTAKGDVATKADTGNPRVVRPDLGRKVHRRRANGCRSSSFKRRQQDGLRRWLRHGREVLQRCRHDALCRQ
ncbi:hypothetical protein PR048_025915 [Dryococelus australis]|uniref:Uncharacterized protein n=1 Tax=Dryococelus australis TaxID=614101 RepID=A0ABQ9GJV6_9NEOP|nr:hypothetical protein PR048_025915 [Dryococelus australis]